MTLDLLQAIRDGLMAMDAVTTELVQWRGEPAIFTRRPAPADAERRYCMINGAQDIADADALNKQRPIVTHTIAFYGNKGAPGSEEDDTRAIDRAAFAARQGFHRQRFSVQPVGYYVIDVQVRGPVPAPVDDDKRIGRAITVTFRLGSTS